MGLRQHLRGELHRIGIELPESKGTPQSLGVGGNGSAQEPARADHEHPGGGAWTTYTPTLTATTANPTLGSGSVRFGRYARIGRLIIGQAAVFFGSAGAAAGTGEYRISIPVSTEFNNGTNNIIVGNGYLYDSSANSLQHVVAVHASGQLGYFIMFKTGAGTFQITDASPWVWSNSDQIDINFAYEVTSG